VMKETESAFLARTAWAGHRATPLAGDASARRYLRLHGGPRPALLMCAPPALCGPIEPFLTMTDVLRDAGLRAPEIYASQSSCPLGFTRSPGGDRFPRNAC